MFTKIFSLSPSKYSNRQLSHPMLTNCHASKSNKFSPSLALKIRIFLIYTRNLNKIFLWKCIDGLLELSDVTPCTPFFFPDTPELLLLQH
jgi:hypothetical protein